MNAGVGNGNSNRCLPPCADRSRCAQGWLVYAIVASLVVVCFGVAPN
jgi:hypothetical protein